MTVKELILTYFWQGYEDGKANENRSTIRKQLDIDLTADLEKIEKEIEEGTFKIKRNY